MSSSSSNSETNAPIPPPPPILAVDLALEALLPEPISPILPSRSELHQYEVVEYPLEVRRRLRKYRGAWVLVEKEARGS